MRNSNTEIIVCIGSGGVGKTTISASLGVWGALQGKKVLVLTVDPARRLATTFGLRNDGSDQLIHFPEASGELWASVLNSKLIFDEFVQKAANKDTLVQNLFKNKLYLQLSTTLSGSQEFTALEKLYSAYEANLYDLIILDTPPTKHAVDFLQAPQKIATLFSEPIAKWFKQTKSTGLLQHLFQFGTKRVLQALQSLTGSEFITELRNFFLSIESWQMKLEERTQRVHQLLLSPNTTFNLITAFDSAKLQEAKAFSKDIREGGYHLRTLTLNRSFPNWLPKPSTSSTEVNIFCRTLNDYYEKRWLDLQGMAHSIQDLDILMLPEYDQDIADLKGLRQLVGDYKWIHTAPIPTPIPASTPESKKSSL